MAGRRPPGKRAAARPSPDGTAPRGRSAAKAAGHSPGKPAKASARTGAASSGQRGPVKAAHRGAVRVSRRGLAVGGWHGRWISVGAIVASVLVGLPLAHAVLGELGALALGLVVAGFALGRSTMRRS